MIDTKKRNFNKKMGLGFVLASTVFYFLPDFIMIDVLPDVIGYVLAAYGLTMLGDICEDLNDARRRFMKMILIGAARIFGLFASFAMFGANERPTAILTVTFVLGVAECLFLIPAVKSLFEGLVYLGTRHNGTAVFKRPPKKNGKKTRADKNSYSDTVMRQAILFVLLKNIFSILPEMLALSADDASQYYNYNRYDQINYFRVLSMIVIIIAGIVWLRRVRRYFRALINDQPFMDSLAEKYRTDVLPNESIFLRRRASLAFLVMSIGGFAAIDFYFDGNDGINIIPDAICAICILVGILIISTKQNRWRMPAIAMSAGYAVLSAATWKLNYDFTYAYTARDVSRDIVANRLWKALTAVSVLEGVCFTCVIVLAALVLRETIEEHTGYFPKHATIDPVSRTQELQKKLTLMLNVSTALAAVAGVAGVFRVWMFCSESFIADISWIIEMALTAVFAVMFCWSMAKIKEAVEEKYMLS